MRVGIFIRLLSIFAVIAVFLIWGLPYVIQMGPTVCERWKMTSGICSPNMQGRLHAIDGWTDRWLRSYIRGPQLKQSIENAREGLVKAEETTRRGLGDEKVDAAIRGTEIAIDQAEHLFGDDAKEKLQDIPSNAQKLIAEVRAALDRLREVLSRTQRRAEDVTTAVDDTRKALDALSSALPKQD